MKTSRLAEAAVVGAVLRDATLLDTVAAEIRPEHFGHFVHVVLWRTMLDLHRRAVDVDVVSVAEAMRTNGTMVDLGPKPYTALADLFNDAPAIPPVGHVRLVRKFAALRSLIAVCRDVIDEATTFAGADAGVLITDAQRRIGECVV